MSANAIAICNQKGGGGNGKLRIIFAHDPKGKVAAAYHDLTKEVLKGEKQRQKAKSDLLR